MAHLPFKLYTQEVYQLLDADGYGHCDTGGYCWLAIGIGGGMVLLFHTTRVRQETRKLSWSLMEP